MRAIERCGPRPSRWRPRVKGATSRAVAPVAGPLPIGAAKTAAAAPLQDAAAPRIAGAARRTERRVIGRDGASAGAAAGRRALGRRSTGAVRGPAGRALRPIRARLDAVGTRAFRRRRRGTPRRSRVRRTGRLLGAACGRSRDRQDQGREPTHSRSIADALTRAATKVRAARLPAPRLERSRRADDVARTSAPPTPRSCSWR